MLNNMSRTLPPIFLLVAAFLVNLTLTRLVALEREQIGLLKALGYADSAIVLHYFKFVALIVAIGITLGGVVGTWLGLRVTALFGEFFHFPFLVFAKAPELYVTAGALSAAAAATGALRALREVVKLPPAVAMQPPAPPIYRRLLPASIQLDQVVSQPTLMMIRNIARHPVRAAFTSLGMALATAILVVSLFTRDTVEQLIEVTYFLADRQDATIGFAEKRVDNVVEQVNRLQLPNLIRDTVLGSGQEPDRTQDAVRQLEEAIEAGRAEGIDIDDFADIDLEMPARPDPALTLADLHAVLARPTMLPLGASASALDKDFRYENGHLPKAIRVTTDRDFFEMHSESVEFWTPGSPAFPDLSVYRT